MIHPTAPLRVVESKSSRDYHTIGTYDRLPVGLHLRPPPAVAEEKKQAEAEAEEVSPEERAEQLRIGTARPRPQKDVYIGIDTSKKCTALCFFFVATQTYHIHYWCADTVVQYDRPTPLLTLVHHAPVEPLKQLCLAILAVISRTVRARQSVSVSVEPPLQPGRNVDPRQSAHTDSIIASLRDSSSPYVSLPPPFRIRNNWLHSHTHLAKYENIRNLPRRQAGKYVSYLAYEERAFPRLVPAVFYIGDEEDTPDPESVRLANTHPVSDIVDAIAVTWTLQQLEMWSKQ
jgi:hypothetical protein